MARKCRPALAVILVALACAGAQAGPLGERIRERRQQMRQAAADDGSAAADIGAEFGGSLSCEQWRRKLDRLQQLAPGRGAGPAPDQRDVAYGPGPLEKLDVFLPKARGGQPAPIILMVHGGGWCAGDKQAASVTSNKVARWTAKGFVFASVDYPMVADGADALAQANSVARAAAYVQAQAARWGGDPGRLILIGHSAGAHLVSLVNADADIRRASRMRPILGTVSLDAGALDVVAQMPHVYPFLRTRYREAFGDSERGWVAASPYHRLDTTAAPWLGVCSTERKDDSCGQARAYAEKSNGLGIRAAVLPEDKNHGAINKELGLPGSYTAAVETFMSGLDPVVAALLR
ncbi:MAG TPA: alpha/beta hydrolase [Rhodocyclaceae bacterium]